MKQQHRFQGLRWMKGFFQLTGLPLLLGMITTVIVLEMWQSQIPKELWSGLAGSWLLTFLIALIQWPKQQIQPDQESHQCQNLVDNCPAMTPSVLTKQRQAECAVRESEERFRQIAETIEDVFFINFPDLSQISYISPAYEKVWGRSCQSLYQDPNSWFSTVHPDDHQRIETALKQQLAGEPFQEEYRIIRPDGSIRWIFSRAFPRFNQAGELQRFIGLASDITERKQAEIALQKSEEQFRILVTQAPVGIFQTDAQGKCLYVNSRWMEITGLSSETALEEGWSQALHPDDREATLQEWIQATTEGRSFNLEYRLQRPDGTVCWVSGQSIAVRDETGAIVRYFGTVMDITIRKQAEATKQALIESIPDFLVRMRRDGIYLEVLNRGAVQLLLPAEGDISGASITEMMHPVIAQERLELAQKALALGTVQTQEYRFELNGSTFYEEARIAPLGHDEVLLVVRDITERYRSEQALRESEEKFRQLAENIHQVFFILSAEGEILYISPAYEQVWQRSCEDLYSNPRSWLKSIYFEDRPRIAAALQNQIRLKQAFNEIYRIVRADGQIRWIAAQSFPLQDEVGNVVRFTGIAEDITQQKQVEAALRQSEATKQAIIEAIPDLLIQMHSDGTYINFIADNRFNIINPTQIRENANLNDVLPHHLAQLRVHYVQQALESDATQIYEHEILIEGKQCYEEVRVVPLPQDEVLIMVRDITDRKEAEQALKHQKEMFQAIVDNIPVMITLYDAQGQLEFINPELERILGWSIAEWQQRHILAECYPDPLHLQAVLEHMRAATGEWKDLTTLNAWGHSLETSWANVRLSDGGFLGIGQDISDRKRKERALQQAMEAAESANQAKSMFLANMSHELRTPLNVILGFAQVMSHDPLLTPGQHKDLQTIRRSGDHLLSLINDVLDLAKIEAGQFTIAAVQFDLIALLNSLQSMLAERANSKGVPLYFDIAPQVPQFILADDQKLRQILLNLLSNAIKFTAEGTVSLRVTVKPEHELTGSAHASPPIVLCLEVSDTGVGIASEELDLIFDAFVQAQAGKNSASGTGLGLTISRQLLELMGGTISVKSVVGQGSTFTLTLPVYPARGIDLDRDHPQALIIGLVPGQPHWRILVVDDQPENRQVLVRFMAQLGLEVQEAMSGEEAIQVWQNWQPDLIWMDIRMPGLDGYETTRKIRAMQQEKTSVIIALTAQVSQNDRELALAAGCDDYISKPFQEGTLFLKLQEYLGLKYLYAEIQPDSQEQPGTAIPSAQELLDTFEPSLLDRLSAEWWQNLSHATLCGNDQMIADLLTQIPPELEQLNHYFNDLADQYLFEEILQAIAFFTQTDHLA